MGVETLIYYWDCVER